MRNFDPTNPHGTAFAPKQWLYEKEAARMESSKCIILVSADTVHTSAGPQTTPFHGGIVQGPEWKYAEVRDYQSSWYCVCTKAMVI